MTNIRHDGSIMPPDEQLLRFIADEEWATFRTIRYAMACDGVFDAASEGGDRRVDRAIQRLRKQGLITFSRVKRAWCLS